MGTIIRVNVANLAAIRNEHGREAAEAALVRAAECVARQAGEGDTVAREQGGDLVLLVEGRLAREAAAYAGRDIIARGLKFSNRLPPHVTLTLHVAVACAPLPAGPADKVLAILGNAIAESARTPGGRALTIIGNAATPAIARGDNDVVLSPMTEL